MKIKLSQIVEKFSLKVVCNAKSQIFQLRHIIIIMASFGLFFYAKIHPAFIIVATGILGAVLR